MSGFRHTELSGRMSSAQTGMSSAENFSGRRRGPQMRGRRWRGWLVRLLLVVGILAVFNGMVQPQWWVDQLGWNRVNVSGRIRLAERATVENSASGTADNAGADGAGATEPGTDRLGPGGIRLLFVPLERDFSRRLQPFSYAESDAKGRFRLQVVNGGRGAARGRHLVYVWRAGAGQQERSETSAARAAEAQASEMKTRLPGRFSEWLEEQSATPSADDGQWVQVQEIDVPLLGTSDLSVEVDASALDGARDDALSGASS